MSPRGTLVELLGEDDAARLFDVGVGLYLGDLLIAEPQAWSRIKKLAISILAAVAYE